ncbi:MAG: ribosomal-processing cysteine protease Prp [Oscillospiraceae bacterium]|nr:ribosomal-processing cysteine protease Prp [Oscillospiraceae bacterium]
MTRVEFFDQDGKICGFSVMGHSGYAEAGADIVCAAVSTAVQFAETTITDVLGVQAKTKVNESKAQITLTLPASYEDEEAVQAVLTGMMLTLCELRDQYPDHIEVIMEVQ